MKEIIDVKTLFEKCKEMVTVDTAVFIHKSGITQGGLKYMMFDHHMSNYTTWKKYPYATECRGIMFEVTDLDIDKAEVIRVMSRPMEKFFNWGENPFTMIPINRSDIQLVMDKADGSIVSTYLDGDGVVRLKSRFSIESEQAIKATELLHSVRYSLLLGMLNNYCNYGYLSKTFDFEYVAPDNRIVLNYEEPQLLMHNSRMNNTGEMNFINYYGEVFDRMKDHHFYTPLPIPDSQFKDLFSDNETVDSTRKIIENLKAKLTRVEGFVVNMKDGTRMKIKTDWYSVLHHNKDSVNSDKNLWYLVIERATDDVKTLFNDDQTALDRIDAYERYYIHQINLHKKCFYDIVEATKGMDTVKDKVMKAKELSKESPCTFNLFMNYVNHGKEFYESSEYLDEHLRKYHEQYTKNILEWSK